jgi:hypothetical protein
MCHVAHVRGILLQPQPHGAGCIRATGTFLPDNRNLMNCQKGEVKMDVSLIFIIVVLPLVLCFLEALGNIPTKEQRQQREEIHRGLKEMADGLKDVSAMMNEKIHEMEKYRERVGERKRERELTEVERQIAEMDKEIADRFSKRNAYIELFRN